MLDLSVDDPLEDFEARDYPLLGKSRHVYVSGTGPGVIVMAEIPCISPHVARFARWVRAAGYTVYLPHLFGRDGAAPTKVGALWTLGRACISAEFKAFAANATSPATQWLRALAAEAHRECGGPGVGAIGMCFTGNFALSMTLEKAVIAPVMAQPSLPLNHPAGMAIAPDEIAAIRARMEEDDLTVLGYRFEGDRLCQAARFAAFQQALGDRFQPHVLPDTAANPDAPLKNPHSVLTIHLIDEEGQPTLAARDEILRFLEMRLRAGG